LQDKSGAGPEDRPALFSLFVTAQFMSAKGLNFRFGCVLPTLGDWGEALMHRSKQPYDHSHARPS
jgi:hypothetical protein